MRHFLWWTLFVVTVFWVEDVSPCAENPPLCMMELLTKWEEFRVTEIDAVNVTLPVLYYTKTSLDILCNIYNGLDAKCEIQSCEDPVSIFVKRHFGYTCGIDSKNQQCIREALLGSNCTESINEAPKIGGDLNCANINKFVPCAEEVVKSKCDMESFAIVMKTIQTYGCDEKIDLQKVDEFLNIREGPTSTSTITPEVTTEQSVSSTTSETTTTTSEILLTTTTTTDLVEVTTSENPTTVELTTTEEESSGEQPEQITTTTTIVEIRTRKPKRFKAKNMTDCYSSILSDFGRFLKATPSSSFIRFPLFGLKPMEVDVLCSKKEISQECVDYYCVGNCRHPPMKSFVDAQLSEVCRLKNRDDFELEFTCLQNVLADSPECLTFINTTSPNRCDGHGHFRNCISEKLVGECSGDTLTLLDRLQTGFGCRLLTGFEVEEIEIEASGDEGSGTEVQESSNTTLVEEKPVQNGTVFEEVLLTKANETRNCTDDVKDTALSCLAPLLRLWTGIKANRKDTEVVFPIFQFSKFELLELCDSFINYRTCFHRTDSAVCNSLPVALFAEEHFGQVCTIQTIEASIRTHDCINALDHRDLSSCNRFSNGDTLPGKRKCTKVRRYTKCLRRLVKQSCGHLMLAHYDNIVDRFGC